MNEFKPPQNPFAQRPEAPRGKLAENIMHFARVLRAAGLPVGPGKVLDAIQENVPLVTTSIGAEGIPDADNVMNIANSAEDFSNTVIRLDAGDAALIDKMKHYEAWLKTNFSKENAMRFILEDFGPPEVSA